MDALTTRMPLTRRAIGSLFFGGCALAALSVDAAPAPSFTGTSADNEGGDGTSGWGASTQGQPTSTTTTTVTDRFATAGAYLHGYANGSQIWQVDCFAASDRAGLQVGSSGTLNATTSGIVVAFLDIGGADHFVSASLYSTTAARYTGVAARVVDYNNMILLRTYSATQVRLTKIIGGVETDLAGGPITVPGGITSSDIITLFAVGTTVSIYNNGVQIGTSYTVADAVLQGSCKGGLVGKGTSIPGFTNFSAGVAGSANALVDTNAYNPHAILQRDPSAITGGANVRTHHFSLNYVGATPASVQYQLVDQVSGTAIAPYAAIAATIGGGSVTGMAALPTNTAGNGYYILVRTLDASSNVLATHRSSPFAVGAIFDCAGQSNMADRFGAGVRGAVPRGTNSIWQFDGRSKLGGWNGQPTYTAYAMANDLSVAIDCPVGLFNSAVSATAITAHVPAGTYGRVTVRPASTALWAAELALLNAVGGDCEGVLWDQGETGAPYTDEPDYALMYAARSSALRSATGRTPPQQPSYVANLSYGFSFTDAQMDSVRAFLPTLQSAAPSTYFSHDTVTLEKVSGDLHMDAAGLRESGARFARTVGYVYGICAVDARGPVPQDRFVTQNGATFVVTVPFDLRGHARLTGTAPLLGFGYQTMDGLWHDSGSGGSAKGPADAAINVAGNAVIFTASGPVQAVRYGYGLKPFNNVYVGSDLHNIPRGTVLASATNSTSPISAEPMRHVAVPLP